MTPLEVVEFEFYYMPEFWLGLLILYAGLVYGTWQLSARTGWYRWLWMLFGIVLPGLPLFFLPFAGVTRREDLDKVAGMDKGWVCPSCGRSRSSNEVECGWCGQPHTDPGTD